MGSDVLLYLHAILNFRQTGLVALVFEQRANELNLDWLAYGWKYDSSATILQVLGVKAGLFAMNRDENLGLDFLSNVEQVSTAGMAEVCSPLS